MLPDFLKTKEKLHKMLYYEMMQNHLSHMGPLANIPVSMIFEGNKTVTVREDGSVEERNLEEVTAELEIKMAEFDKMNHEMVLDKINDVSEEMAGKLKISAYEEIEKSAEEVGNVVSTGGQPFSIDMYFEMLEKMKIDFDEAGNPELPCVVTSRGQHSVVERVLEDLEVPENKIRFNEIIKDKREAWRARESNRKLVG